MKVTFFFALLILLTSCAENKSVYWCGDHACINKKEREAYFKKTMIVEKKIINKDNNKKDLTKSEEIIKKAKANEKKRIANEKNIKKEKKLEQKRLKKEQKKQIKNAKLEEKRLKKEERKIAKKIQEEEKKSKNKLIKKEETKVTKHEKTTSFSSSLQNVEFEQIKDQIIKKNLIRPYPDINDIPN